MGNYAPWIAAGGFALTAALQQLMIWAMKDEITELKDRLIVVHGDKSVRR